MRWIVLLISTFAAATVSADEPSETPPTHKAAATRPAEEITKVSKNNEIWILAHLKVLEDSPQLSKLIEQGAEFQTLIWKSAKGTGNNSVQYGTLKSKADLTKFLTIDGANATALHDASFAFNDDGVAYCVLDREAPIQVPAKIGSNINYYRRGTSLRFVAKTNADATVRLESNCENVEWEWPNKSAKDAVATPTKKVSAHSFTVDLQPGQTLLIRGFRVEVEPTILKNPTGPKVKVDAANRTEAIVFVRLELEEKAAERKLGD